MKYEWKKLLSCLLAVLMLAALVPAAAFAEGEEPAAEISDIAVKAEENTAGEEVPAADGEAAESSEAEAENEVISGSIPWEKVYEAPDRLAAVAEARKEENEQSKPLLAAITTPVISREEAVEMYRNVRLNHIDELSVTYIIPWDGKTKEAANAAALEELDRLRDDACVHVPGEPKLGDSIAHNVDWFYRYVSFEQTQKGTLTVYFHLTQITYFTTMEQEAALDARVAELIERFDLDGKDDYQKLDSIYDWMIRNVRYSEKTVTDDGKPAYPGLSYSAYGAGVLGNAVCEGIALLFYRLSMTAGVDTRYVTSDDHAWNIARLADRYYYLDATWDLNHSASPSYFLCGSESWASHKPTEEYYDSVFAANYPLSKTDFGSSTIIGSCGSKARFSFSVPRGTLSISGSGSMADLTAAAEAPWSSYFSLIKRVEVGSGITRIGNYSFADCYGLEYVKLPATLTEIGSYAVGSTDRIRYEACVGAFEKIVIEKENPYFYAGFTLNSGDHVYTDEIKTASCTESGSIVHSCACGESYTENIPPLGHRFSGNICTRCGYVRENGGESPFESILSALRTVFELFDPLNFINRIISIFRGVTI